jgi:hypothetical protein
MPLPGAPEQQWREPAETTVEWRHIAANGDAAQHLNH